MEDLRKWIVVWTKRVEATETFYGIDSVDTDHWRVFEDFKEAESFYKNIWQEDDTYVASLTRILRSSDYNGELEEDHKRVFNIGYHMAFDDIDHETIEVAAGETLDEAVEKFLKRVLSENIGDDWQDENYEIYADSAVEILSDRKTREVDNFSMCLDSNENL
tara:strand:+ start:21 stop:506 length:486 start_codon:yes stop_codon:yes gene_type:complete